MAERNHKASTLYKRGFKTIEGGRQQPTFEATVVEQLTIKRFLDFAKADIAFQIEEMKREKMTLAQYQESQQTAQMLGVYLDRLREGINAMTLAPVDPEPSAA